MSLDLAQISTAATEGVVQFPSLGGVAVAKRLTGWSVASLHTLGGPPRRFAPPLLRRGIGDTAFSTCNCEKREPSQATETDCGNDDLECGSQVPGVGGIPVEPLLVPELGHFSRDSWLELLWLGVMCLFGWCFRH